MKNILPAIFAAFLFLLAFLFFLPPASAQSWLWAGAGTGYGAEGWAVATDSAGNIFAAGSSTAGSSAITFGSINVPLPPSEQVLWVKYSPTGNVLWAGGTDSGLQFAPNICTDRAGDLFVYGYTYTAKMQIGSLVLINPLSPSTASFLVKISPGGTVLWAEIIPVSTGGFMTADSSGNIYIAGTFSSPTFTIGSYTLTNANSLGGTSDIFVAKYSPSGSLVWASSIGGTGDDFARSIIISPTGYIYVAGQSSSPAFSVGASTIAAVPGYYDALIAKFSLAGTPLWADISGDTGSASGVALTADISGNVYMAGDYFGMSVSFGADTLTRSYSDTPYSAVFFVGYSSADTLRWARTICSASAIYSYSVAASSLCSKVWVCGAYTKPAVIAPGDTLAVDTPSVDPVFIVGYDLNCNPLSNIGLASGGDDQAMLACDPSGNLAVCGDFIDAPGFSQFTIGSDTFSENSPAYTEYMFVAKYGNLPDTTYSHTDTTLCIAPKGDILTAPPGYAAYSWNNGTPGASQIITGGGQYYVYCLNCADVLIDSFNVTTATIDTTYNDTLVCAPLGNAILYAPGNYNSFVWNTGDTGTSITANVAGAYWVYASQACNAALDSFMVKVKDIAFSLGNDTTACSPVTLYAPPFATTHTWQDNSTGTSYIANISGTYFLSINSQGCPYRDSISVNIITVPQYLHDTAVCLGQAVQITLQANVPQGWNVLWNDSSKLNTLQVTDTGTYWVMVSDSVCQSVDTAIVSSQNCDCWVSVPNAFSPNNDGKNDLFYPIIEPGCTISNYSFSIYNRWGNRVFLSTDPTGKWNGMYKGVPAELGVYDYQLSFNAGSKNIKHFLKGDVTLVR